MAGGSGYQGPLAAPPTCSGDGDGSSAGSWYGDGVGKKEEEREV
jgi:hypothetical protein